MRKDHLDILLRLIILAVIVWYFTACASKGPASAAGGISCQTLAGHYEDHLNFANTLDISQTCTFTDSVCGYDASYTVPNAQTGATIITVNGTNGAPGCMANTDHQCTVEFTGYQLAIECDAGAVLYLFNKVSN